MVRKDYKGKDVWKHPQGKGKVKSKIVQIIINKGRIGPRKNLYKNVWSKQLEKFCGNIFRECRFFFLKS